MRARERPSRRLEKACNFVINEINSAVILFQPNGLQLGFRKQFTNQEGWEFLMPLRWDTRKMQSLPAALTGECCILTSLPRAAQCPQARGSSEAGQLVFPLLHRYLVILKKCPRPSHLPPEATEKAGGHTAPGALRTWVRRTPGGRNQHGPRARATLFRECCRMKCSHLKSVSLRLDTAVERPQILE